MNTCKTYNPPIKRNGVEVTGIDKIQNVILCVVHMASTGKDFSVAESQFAIDCSVRDMIDYLDLEGFIPPGQNWHGRVAVVIHPRNGGNSLTA